MILIFIIITIIIGIIMIITIIIGIIMIIRIIIVITIIIRLGSRVLSALLEPFAGTRINYVFCNNS